METLLGVIFIVFGLLQIILFFKIWGMTNDVREIKYKYLKRGGDDITSLQNASDSIDESSPIKDNDEVIEIGSSRRMFVYGKTNDGQYNCYAGYNGVGFIGKFSEVELKLTSRS